MLFNMIFCSLIAWLVEGLITHVQDQAFPQKTVWDHSNMWVNTPGFQSPMLKNITTVILACKFKRNN